MDTDETARGHGSRDRILVGVDRSESSLAALAWAAGQARLTGAALHVVHAWSFVPYPYVNPVLVRDTAAETAREMLRHAIDEVVGDDPGIEIVAESVPGHPARVLGDLGKSARMIVIGGGGHGELAGLLLGSVGLHLAAHAPVPVVIVPRTEVAATVPGLARPLPSSDAVAEEPAYHPLTFL